MAYTDLTGLGDCIRLYSRTGAGFSSSGDGTDITGWTDDSASGVNATNETNAPTHDATPPVGTLGPAAEYADETDNGFDFGLNLTGVTSWTFGCVLYASTLTSFRNIFSSGGGASEGSLYTNSGTLTYQEASTEASSTTLSTGQVYTIVFVANGTNYRLYVDGSLVHTFSITPADQPSTFKVHTYGGSGAGWAGHAWSYVVYNADKSANVSTIHAALLEEAEGATGVTMAADAVAFSSSVADAALFPSLSMAADAVTYSATVADAALSYNANLSIVAEQVSYSAAVADASLFASLSITADAVSYTSAVGDAALSAAVPIDDDFAGTGSLQNYTTHNSAAVASVGRVSGRYVAEIPSNDANASLWYNADDGRLDYRELTWPFRIIIRNVGIGNTSADTQTSPDLTSEPYMFCGYHINNDLSSPTNAYRHMVVGSRGPAGGGVGGRTVEVKTNASGSSSVSDVGQDALSGTRADLMIIGHANKTTNWYWQEPNSDPIRDGGATADSWTEATMPGSEPSWNDTVYAGPVTYAFELYSGPAFVGTADAIQDGSVLSCDAASYSATVGDASFSVGFGITAEQVSYASSVADASLFASLDMTAEAVTYSSAVADANLYAGITLSAEQVGYTSTVADAGLNLSMAADSVSYATAVADAALSYGLNVLAEAVSYSTAVEDAALGRVMPAEVASYSSAVGDASFAIGGDQVLLADALAYAFTVGAATFSIGESVIIEPKPAGVVPVLVIGAPFG